MTKKLSDAERDKAGAILREHSAETLDTASKYLQDLPLCPRCKEMVVNTMRVFAAEIRTVN